MSKNTEVVFIVLIVVVSFFAVTSTKNQSNVITSNAFRTNPHVSMTSDGTTFKTEETTEYKGPLHIYAETNQIKDPLKDIFLTIAIKGKQVAEHQASKEADFFYCKETNSNERKYDYGIKPLYKCFTQFTFDYETRTYYLAKAPIFSLSSLDQYDRRGVQRRVILQEGHVNG
ncbi:hypothetical protein HYY69_02375 [Candidatus Woesearchaeota archaeon]|nr:hypothetical protein [Candidatus Woesearchaeota archaeon]